MTQRRKVIKRSVKNSQTTSNTPPNQWQRIANYFALVTQFLMQYSNKIIIGFSTLFMLGLYIYASKKQSINLSEQEICDGFELVHGDLNEATAIVVGEIHQNLNSTTRCVNQLTKHYKDHKILIEGNEKGRIVPCTIGERQGRICEGWDNLERVTIDYKHHCYMEYLKLLADFEEMYRKLGGNSAALDLILEDNLQKASITVNQEKAKFGVSKLETVDQIANNYMLTTYTNEEKGFVNSLIKQALCNKMLLLREKFTDYKKIIHHIIVEVQPLAEYHADQKKLVYSSEYVMKSNVDLAESIIKSQEQKVFTVAVAGKSHVDREQSNVEMKNAVDYFYQTLTKNSGNRYAVLMMLDDDNNVQHISTPKI